MATAAVDHFFGRYIGTPKEACGDVLVLVISLYLYPFGTSKEHPQHLEDQRQVNPRDLGQTSGGNIANAGLDGFAAF